MQNIIENIFLGIILGPFLLVIGYIIGITLLRVVVLLWTEAFSLMGWEGPKRYIAYNHSWLN